MEAKGVEQYHEQDEEQGVPIEVEGSKLRWGNSAVVVGGSRVVLWSGRNESRFIGQDASLQCGRYCFDRTIGHVYRRGRVGIGGG